MKVIVNGHCIVPNDRGDFVVRDGLAVAFDGLIRAVEPLDRVDLGRVEVVDAGGLFVAPGFINTHIHGCNGFDTMDEAPEALAEMSKFLPRTGVTAFLPTTMTMPLEIIQAALRRVREAMFTPAEGARVLGAHVEGPYISAKHKGAQAEDCIRAADFAEIADFTDVIKIITIAPEELAADSDFIQRCCRAGVIVSIGHSDADYDTAMKAIEKGANHITHLFNAQTGLHHRSPGIVGAALDSNAVVELIADNVHVHPAAQRLIWRAKAHSQIELITDSMRACGLSDGVYELGGQRVTVRGERALLDDGTIAASIAPLNRVLAKFRDNTDASVPEVVELVTKNPAVELGIYDRLGSLEVGKAGDIVLFDEDFNIKAAYVEK